MDSNDSFVTTSFSIKSSFSFIDSSSSSILAPNSLYIFNKFSYSILASSISSINLSLSCFIFALIAISSDNLVLVSSSSAITSRYSALLVFSSSTSSSEDFSSSSERLIFGRGILFFSSAFSSTLIVLSLLIISSFALASINFSSATVYSLLIFGLFLIDFALIPNLSVLMVSASLYGEGEQVTISAVLEFPPKESCNTLVSLESLYGICVDFPSVSDVMTNPSIVRDLLIFFASSSLLPAAPVFPTFSLPAKSTRYSFPTFVEKSCEFVCVTVNIKIA
mmetsp:Transcript_301/g.307  ORF Transcript_301/g.307 Transcript_301/m.307 type:complete len:279 (+) Transcript_301:796-1632(+)